MRGTIPARRIGDVEVLRGIAICGVLEHHIYGNIINLDWFHPSGLSAWLSFDCGVQLFFVISGFVVTLSLLSRMAGRRSSDRLAEAWNFVVDRFWRLSPSAWLWLGIILVASATFNESAAFRSFHSNLHATAAGVLDYANIRFGRLFGVGPYGGSYQYWTLSLEEQFYFVLACVVMLAGDLLSIIAATACVVKMVLPVTTPLGAATDFANLASGVVLALAWRERRKKEPIRLSAAGFPVVSVGLILVMGYLSSSHVPFADHRLALVGLPCAILVWLAAYDRGLIAGCGFVRRILIWIGHRSYALYLVHVPVIEFVREVSFRMGAARPVRLWETLSVILLSLVFAEINYRVLERRLRARWGHRGKLRTAALLSAVGAAGFAEREGAHANR